MEALRIVLLCIAAAVLYGVAHDQVTIRMSLEYFTVLHPRLGWLGDLQSPTVLACAWGVIATWWVGLILGLPIAYCCRRGPAPKLVARDLVRPLALMLAAMGVGAAIAALVGRELALSGSVVLHPALASGIDPERRLGAIMALWAHSASYLLGTVGGVALAVHLWLERRRRFARAA